MDWIVYLNMILKFKFTQKTYWGSKIISIIQFKMKKLFILRRRLKQSDKLLIKVINHCFFMMKK